MEFEWDSAKAQANRKKHGIDFRTAAKVFMDPYVIEFDDDTPADLIRAVQPDLLVKGGDWPLDRIAGADFVLAHGGRVRSLPFAKGYSTTALVRRIRKTHLP